MVHYTPEQLSELLDKGYMKRNGAGTRVLCGSPVNSPHVSHMEDGAEDPLLATLRKHCEEQSARGITL